MRNGKYEYTIKAYKGMPERMIEETFFISKTFCDIDIDIYRKRIKKGEINRIEVIHHEDPYDIENIFF